MDIAVTSTDVPELPTCTLTVPDGWTQAQADRPGVLAAAVSDGPASNFTANVVVSVTSYEAPVDLAAVTGGVRRRLLEFPRTRIISDEQVDVGSLPASLIRATYVHPTAGTVVQSVLTVSVPVGATVPVLDVVGTCGADRIKQDVPVVDAVLRSLRIGGG